MRARVLIGTVDALWATAAVSGSAHRIREQPLAMEQRTPWSKGVNGGDIDTGTPVPELGEGLVVRAFYPLGGD